MPRKSRTATIERNIRRESAPRCACGRVASHPIHDGRRQHFGHAAQLLATRR
jgi:hypothetical protein